jgi:hypothetical protein
MTEQAKHSTLPWALLSDEPDCGSNDVEYLEIHTGEFGTPSFSVVANVLGSMEIRRQFRIADEDRANAALIVRAVNSHDGLLSAAKEALDALNRLMPNIVMDAKDSLRLAIRDAEAKQ